MSPTITTDRHGLTRMVRGTDAAPTNARGPHVPTAEGTTVRRLATPAGNNVHNRHRTLFHHRQYTVSRGARATRHAAEQARQHRQDSFIHNRLNPGTT